MHWRELYARNQAAIADAHASAGLTGLAGAPPTAFPGSLSTMPLPRTPHGDHSSTSVHVPATLDRSVPAAVVCMLHGCTQDPASFAAATAMNRLADRHGFVVAYPGQPRSRNAQGCWNWFEPRHQQRAGGEPATIARALEDLIAGSAGCAIDPTRVFVAGLSSGAAMAVILAGCYPDLVAAVAAHSGLPYRSAHDVGSAFAVMRSGEGDPDTNGALLHAAMGTRARVMPSLVIHGSADRTVHPANARALLRQTMGANRLVAPAVCAFDAGSPSAREHGQAPGGRGFTRSQWVGADRRLVHELIEVDGLGHAWSGGAAGGSFTDPRGPSATEAIWTFFSRVGTQSKVAGALPQAN